MQCSIKIHSKSVSKSFLIYAVCIRQHWLLKHRIPIFKTSIVVSVVVLHCWTCSQGSQQCTNFYKQLRIHMYRTLISFLLLLLQVLAIFDLYAIAHTNIINQQNNWLTARHIRFIWMWNDLQFAICEMHTVAKRVSIINTLETFYISVESSTVNGNSVVGAVNLKLATKTVSIIMQMCNFYYAESNEINNVVQFHSRY